MARRTVVVATHNPGKLDEFRALLPGIALVSLTDAAPSLTDISETGGTYLENATIKARVGAAATGLPSLGDDSGLKVDALDGAPGLYSARYSGGGAELNVEKLLRALGERPRSERTARFRCLLVLADPDLSIALLVAEGTCEGFIDVRARGEHGFGYDPVFVPTEQRGERTLAEMGPSEKNAISHRGNACRALIARL